MCMSTAATTASGAADQVAGLLERANKHPGHGDHDGAVGHAGERGRGVAGADIGHLANGVEL